MKEYIPRGFKSWWQYRRYQCICDIISAIGAFAGLVILCLWAGD